MGLVEARHPDSNASLLQPEFRKALAELFEKMHKRGCDPVIWEGKRSEERQRFLYSTGRKESRKYPQKPVEWSMTNAYTEGKAVTIMSKYNRFKLDLFFDILQDVARSMKVFKTYPEDPSRLDWLEE